MPRLPPATTGQRASASRERAPAQRSEQAAHAEDAVHDVPAPVLRQLQAQFGNVEVLAVLQGGDDALQQLLADALCYESDGMGAMAEELLSNGAVQQRMAEPSAPRPPLLAPTEAPVAPETEDTLWDEPDPAFDALWSGLCDEVLAPGAAGVASASATATPAADTTTTHSAPVAPAAAQDATSLPGTGAPGWLVSAVALLSPPLADILDKGIVGAFREDFEQGVTDWLTATFEDPSPMGIASALDDTLWQVSDTVLGVASGDQACCTAMSKWLSGTLAQADVLLRSNTQLAQLSQEQSGKWTSALGNLGALIDTEQLMEAVSGVTEAVTRDVGGLVDALGKANETLGAQVADFLGIDADALSAIIADGIAALFAGVSSVVADAEAGLLDALFALPGMTQLGQLADFAVEMRDGAAWLADNWEAPDLWERAAELSQELPRFAALLTAGGAWWTSLSDSVRAQFTDASARLDAFCQQWLGFPLLAPLLSAVSSLLEGVRTVIDSPLWGQIAEAAGTGVSFAGTVLGTLLELAVSVAGAMVFPPVLLGVLMGTAIELIPDCYLPPIFDVLVTVGILGLSMVLGPLAAQFPAFAPLWQASLLGVLEGLRGLPVEQKAGVLNSFAQLLQGGFADLMLGFGAGLVGGLWDEVTFWLGVAWWVSGAGVAAAAVGVAADYNPVALVWEALTLLDAAYDAHEGEEPAEVPTSGGDTDAPAVEPVQAPSPPDVVTPEAPADWGTLQEWLGELVGNLSEAVSSIWASIAESVVVPLLQAVLTEGPWALGYAAGWGASFLVVEAVLATVTAGLAEVLTIGRAGLAGLKAAVAGGLNALPKLLDAVQVVLRWGDDVFTVLRKIPGADTVIGWLDELWSTAKRWLDDIVGHADDAPGKPKTPDAPDAPKKKPGDPDAPGIDDPDAPKKKKPGDGDGDDSSETIEAMGVWAKLSAATATHLLTKRQLQAEADQIASRDKDIRAITIEDNVAAKRWNALLTLTDGDRARTSKGWIATDDEGGCFYATKDAHADNVRVGDQALDDLEQQWRALFDDTPPTDTEAAEASLQKVADTKVAPRHDGKLDFTTEVALTLRVHDDARIDETKATVTATVTVSPNAHHEEQTLSSGAEGADDLLTRFAAELDALHPEARPEFIKGLQTLGKSLDRSTNPRAPATFDEAVTAMREDPSNRVCRLYGTPLNKGYSFTARAEATADMAIARAVTGLQTEGSTDGLPNTPELRAKFLSGRKGQVHDGTIAGVLDALHRQIRGTLADSASVEAMVEGFTAALRGAGTRIPLYDRFVRDNDPGLVKTHARADNDIRAGLAQLDKKKVDPPTFAAATTEMKKDGSNVFNRLWMGPLSTEVTFSAHAMDQAATAVQGAVARATPKKGVVLPSTDDERRAWISDRKGPIHTSAQFYPDVMPALRGEIEDQGKDAQVVPAMEENFKTALEDDRPPPDYVEILEIYQAVADKAGVSFDQTAWPATDSGTKRAREALRALVVPAYAPAPSGKGLAALNDDLLSKTDPIPASQNGLKGSIFEHWTHQYHQDTLLSGKQRPVFNVVLGGKPHEVNADGSLDGDDTLIECKAVQIHEKPDPADPSKTIRWADTPTDKELIDQMKRYALVITDTSDKTNWLDAAGKVHKFKKVRYVFACKEAADAWEPVLKQHLKDKAGKYIYEVRY